MRGVDCARADCRFANRSHTRRRRPSPRKRRRRRKQPIPKIRRQAVNVHTTAPSDASAVTAPREVPTTTPSGVAAAAGHRSDAHAPIERAAGADGHEVAARRSVNRAIGRRERSRAIANFKIPERGAVGTDRRKRRPGRHRDHGPVGQHRRRRTVGIAAHGFLARGIQPVQHAVTRDEEYRAVGAGRDSSAQLRARDRKSTSGRPHSAPTAQACSTPPAPGRHGRRRWSRDRRGAHEGGSAGAAVGEVVVNADRNELAAHSGTARKDADASRKSRRVNAALGRRTAAPAAQCCRWRSKVWPLPR